jgi:GxxExxY protein
MSENELARDVVDAAFQVHTKLGPGLLESIYERVLEFELTRRGIRVERQVPITVVYDGDEGFRADLIVENLDVLEIKSVETVADIHKKQLLTYLRLADMRLELLINFNEVLIKNGITRIVNRLAE